MDGCACREKMMFGPIVGLSASRYLSQSDGTSAQYFFNVPFAGVAKVLTVAINVMDLDADTEIDIDIIESLDGSNWGAVETLTSTTISAKGYVVYHSDTTKPFGPRVRIITRVAKGTAGSEVGDMFEVRASGKPF